MLVTDLMISLFRLLLIGIAFFTASHLAVRGAVGAELELGGVSPVQPPVSEDLASPPVDSDPWADSFLPTPGRPAAVRIEPVQRPPAVPLVSTPASPQRVSTYQIQQNDHVLRFLEQFQTGYRRAVVERWLARSGRDRPRGPGVFPQEG